MRVHINMDDPKAKALVEYLKSLDFVEIIDEYATDNSTEITANDPVANYTKSTDEDYEIPEWHKDIVRESIAEYKKNPDNYVVWDELKKDLEIKLRQ